MSDTVFDKTMTLQRQNGAQDAMGAPNPGYANVVTGVACALWPASPRTASEFARRDMVVDYQIATPTNIAAKTQDRVLIGTAYYVVISYQPFDNTEFGDPIYVCNVQKRN